MDEELTLIDQARKITAETYIKCVDADQYPDTALKLRSMIDYSIKRPRLYQMYDPTLVSDLWGTIRKQDILTDFIMKLSVELTLRLPNGKTSLVAIVDLLSEAYSINKQPSSAIDDATLERTSTTEDWGKRLSANPWLVGILLLDTVV